jgi:heptosyltransferase-3
MPTGSHLVSSARARTGASGWSGPRRRERGNRKLRFVDRCVGIPLVCIVSVFRRHRPQPAPGTVLRIGVFLFGAIGDSLLASATIPDLRRHFPSARITCFVTEVTRSASSIIDGVDDWIPLPIRRPDKSAAILRANSVDILIDFGQWWRITAVLTAFARARFAIGFRTPRQWRHFAYDAVATHSDQRHELENFRALVALLGVKSEGMPCVRRSPARFELSGAAQWIVLHPWPAGYRSELREWAEERWIAVADAVREWGYGVVITGGPSDRDRAENLAEAMGRRGNHVACAAGQASLSETVHLVERAAAVVSVNTGLMHIAAALDRPLVALHGPTNPGRWGPVSKNAVVIGPGPERGCGYLNLGHEYPARPPDCMECIAANEVLAALARCLGRDVEHAGYSPSTIETSAARLAGSIQSPARSGPRLAG